MKQKLDAVINFRLPQQMKSVWMEQAKAAQLNLGDYIRACVSDNDSKIISHKPTPRKVPKVNRETADPKLIQAIARCGNNLNQIARSLNQGNKENIDIHLELVAINNMLKKEIEL